MDPNDLTVYKSPFPKKRIGKENDGGYIIVDIPDINYDILLSAGIGNDISFEDHLCKLFPNMNCFAFDGTIDPNHFKYDNIKIFKQNIGTINDNLTTDLIPIINSYKTIFLKMDIEGHELSWLNHISSEDVDKISQIVMEFHFPFEEKDKNVFKKINKTHSLVHFHANNCCGVRNYNNVNIPNVFECTYIHKKYFFQLNNESIPGILDSPNIGGQDIFINYPPFVNYSKY
jgi:hypothetical protein